LNAEYFHMLFIVLSVVLFVCLLSSAVYRYEVCRSNDQMLNLRLQVFVF
jgi:hypothetical protein